VTDIIPTPPEYQDDGYPEIRTGWQITDTGTFDWAFSILAKKKAAILSWEERAAAAKARIDAELDRSVKQLRYGIAFMEAQIARYSTEHREELLSLTGGKTIKAADGGKVQWRKQEGRLVVVDEDALGTWLREQDDVTLFRVKVAPDMKALQDNFKKNGVIPPGMEFVATQEKIYIEPAVITTTLARGTK
jgi:phage host-nuclease inhibitor protein Gam